VFLFQLHSYKFVCFSLDGGRNRKVAEAFARSGGKRLNF
jgi:hypothetical protein